MKRWRLLSRYKIKVYEYVDAETIEEAIKKFEDDSPEIAMYAEFDHEHIDSDWDDIVEVENPSKRDQKTPDQEYLTEKELLETARWMRSSKESF